MWVPAHHSWWMNDRRQCRWMRIQHNEAFNSKFPALTEWKSYTCGTGGVMKAFESFWFYNLTVLIGFDWRCSKPTLDRRRRAAPLLAEASLFARQLSHQLPELWEIQLPVVVFIQRAHELLDGPRIAGVLWVITERRRPWSQWHHPELQHQAACSAKTVPPPNGWAVTSRWVLTHLQPHLVPWWWKRVWLCLSRCVLHMCICGPHIKPVFNQLNCAICLTCFSRLFPFYFHRGTIQHYAQIHLWLMWY